MATDPPFMNTDHFVESKSSNSNKIFIKTLNSNCDNFFAQIKFSIHFPKSKSKKIIKQNRISKTKCVCETKINFILFERSLKIMKNVNLKIFHISLP